MRGKFVAIILQSRKTRGLERLERHVCSYLEMRNALVYLVCSEKVALLCYNVVTFTLV